MSCITDQNKVTGMSEDHVRATAHTGKNRLHITLHGNTPKHLLEKLYTEVRFGVADLHPGFNVIVDVSSCNLIHVSGMPIYKKIIDYLISKKVGNVVRVIKNTNLSSRQLSNWTKLIPYHKVMHAYHMEEAEEQLARLARPEG
jgi:hypothetical protein